jgi:hypothetical protein
VLAWCLCVPCVLAERTAANDESRVVGRSPPMEPGMCTKSGTLGLSACLLRG